MRYAASKTLVSRKCGHGGNTLVIPKEVRIAAKALGENLDQQRYELVYDSELRTLTYKIVKPQKSNPFPITSPLG